MGNVEKVDRTPPLNQMNLLRPPPAWRTGTGIIAWSRLA
jgi:hypothetical protein